jgi:hypothetical protein
MGSFRLSLSRGARLIAFPATLAILSGNVSVALGQQPITGFALERFYPSAPGGGWFVMDDLNIGGGFGATAELISSYARQPLQITSANSTQLTVVSDEVVVDVGVAATYHRYRVYLNIPMPALVSGNSGVLGPYQWSGPSVSLGTNPDTISDLRLGFDMRFLGKPGDLLRLGLGAQAIFPTGTRTDYLSDGRYRGMLRFLAAGDAGAFSYASQFGIHIRTLNDAPVPDSPNGNEFLFGASAGRRLNMHAAWKMVLGPEIYGETAFASFFSRPQTGVEGLMTMRLEQTDKESNLRLKIGVGHGLVQHFGAPEWRIAAAVTKTWISTK